MSTEDLSILADALTFALLVTIGGLVVWGVVRATWRRPALRRAMRVCLSAAALGAVGIAGVALWPAARQSVTTVAGAAGIDVERGGTSPSSDERDISGSGFVPSSPRGRTARVFEATTMSDGGVVLVPSPFSDPGQSSGSGTGSGGFGVDPPAVDPGSPPGGGGGASAPPPTTQPPPPTTQPPPPTTQPPPPTTPPPPPTTPPPPPTEPPDPSPPSDPPPVPTP
jgi:hypothetical protein